LNPRILRAGCELFAKKPGITWDYGLDMSNVGDGNRIPSQLVAQSDNRGYVERRSTEGASDLDASLASARSMRELAAAAFVCAAVWSVAAHPTINRVHLLVVEAASSQAGR
jgi:hypothetical protein